MESLAEGSLPLTGLHAKEEEHREVKSGCLKKEKKKIITPHTAHFAKGNVASTRRRPEVSPSHGSARRPGQSHRPPCVLHEDLSWTRTPGGGWHGGCEPPSLSPKQAAGPKVGMLQEMGAHPTPRGMIMFIKPPAAGAPRLGVETTEGMR